MPSTSGRLQLLTPLSAIVTLPLGILAAVFLGGQAALVVFVVGWLLLVPATAILFGPGVPTGQESAEEIGELVEAEIGAAVGGTPEATRNDVDPIEQLRQRYARGEIDDHELERGLEALLETENVDATDQEEIEKTIRRLDDAGDRHSRTRSGRDEPTRKADDDLLTEEET